MFKTKQKKQIEFNVDFSKIEKIKQFQERLGENFPKVGIFVLCYNASDHIEKTISRIPLEMSNSIEEIFIFDDNSPDSTFHVMKEIKARSPWQKKLNIFRNPKNLGYGGNQKVGYRYAINKGLDYVIMVHGDGQYAPEYIPDLILTVLEEGSDVVFASRMLEKKNALKGGMPFYKWVGNQVLTAFENFILGTKLSEFHSGYRLYSTSFLKKVPFEQNTNVFHFDTQIIVQARALGIQIKEIPIQTFYGDEKCNVNGIEYAKDVCLTVLEYRLHQLHIIRRGRYLVERSAVYTRKVSPFSSHEQILSVIDKPGKALELGIGNGLLTNDLDKKKIDLTFATITDPLSKQITCDLDLTSFGREFDYIILSDVVEHVRNGQEFMRYIQQFLKEDGKIIVSIPNISIWFYRLSLLLGRFNYGPKGPLDETHIRFYTLSTTKQLFERSGYIIKKMKETGIPFEVVFESIGKSKVLKLVDRLYYLCAKIWPSMFAYQFVVVAEISSFLAEKDEEKF